MDNDNNVQFNVLKEEEKEKGLGKDNDNNVQFNVRSEDGEENPFSFDLETTTVAELKIDVAREFDVQTEEQRLFYGGLEMEDDKTLSFYGIKADTTVDLREWNYDTRIHNKRLVDGTFTEELDSSSESSKSGSGSGSGSGSSSDGSGSDGSGGYMSGGYGSGSGGYGSVPGGYGSGSDGYGWDDMEE